MPKKRRKAEPTPTLVEEMSRLVRDCSLTQVQIAKAAGVSQPTVHKIRSGQPVQLESAQKVAAALGRPLVLGELQ